MADFQFGNPRVNEHSANCCGKPRGCTMTHAECLFLCHPWKRAVLFGDPEAPCQATSVDPDTHEQLRCGLLNGHAPPCDPIPSRSVQG